MADFYDAFISYGRADSKQFAARLCESLQAQGFRVWFDQTDIPPAVDFQDQIDSGIALAHNFIFVIAPHATNSPYCGKEIELAVQLDKRLIPLLHVEEIDFATWQARNPGADQAAWEDCRQRGCHSGIANLHAELGRRNWIDFRGEERFAPALEKLVATLRRYADYVEQHTRLLRQALIWRQHNQAGRYLLVGSDYEAALAWLEHTDFDGEQLPCEPSALHAEYICAAKKNTHNLFTDTIILYAAADLSHWETVTRALQRRGITVWQMVQDAAGSDLESALHTGVIQAVSVVCLVSTHSAAHPWYQKALAWAEQYRKRLVPVQVGALTEMPAALRNLLPLRFDLDSAAALEQLLSLLHSDLDYYQKRTVFLAAALKWERQDHNPGVLLRGFNLDNAEAWLAQGKQRRTHPPLPVHEAFIQASLANKGQLQTEIFISYSRKDAGFARRLNAELQTCGKTTWFDQESIAEGEDFQREIDKGIANADNFIFILSPDAVASDFCEEETDYAVSLNKRCIPLLYRDTPPDTIPPALAALQWINFKPGEMEFSAGFRQLLRVLDTDREHVHHHTRLHQKAREWDAHGREKALLLRGSELAIAEQWLQEAATKQPPPTRLQTEYIGAGIRGRKRSALYLRLRIAALSVMLVIAVITSIMARHESWEAQRARQEAEHERNRALVAERKSRHDYSRVLDTLAHHELRNGRITDALLLGLETVSAMEDTGTECGLPPSTRQVLYQGLSELRETYVLPHEAAVVKVAFSPDGEWLASTSKDGTARLWSVRGGTLRGLLAGHTGGVWFADFSPDGKHLLTVSEDHTARLWRSPDGELAAVLEGHEGPVVFGAFSPDGAWIVTASDDTTARLWRTASLPHPNPSPGGRGALVLPHQAEVAHAAFSPDSRLLATAAGDGAVHLWHTDGSEVAVLRVPVEIASGAARRVAFNPAGSLLVAAYDNGVGALWNMADMQLLDLVVDEQRAWIRQAVFSPDGKLLLTASADHSARLWRGDDGAMAGWLQGHEGPVWDANFSPDGRFIVTASWDNTARLWSADSELLGVLAGHEDYVYHAVFSPDGEWIATASLDGSARLWRRQPGFGFAGLRGHSGQVLQARFNPDGASLLTTSEDYTLRLWNRDGKPLLPPGTQQSAINRICFHPDGRTFASADLDGTVMVWNSADGVLRNILGGHAGQVTALTYAPGGELLASAGRDGTARLWKPAEVLDTEGPVLSHDGGAVMAAAFDAAGTRLITAGEDKAARIWDASSGEQSIVLRGHRDTVYQARFHPGGEVAATASADSSVRLWRIADGSLQAILEGHQGAVLDVIFIAVGDKLASAGEDRTVRVWEARSGRLLQTLSGHRDRIMTLDVATRGNLLLSASLDNTVRLWQAQAACGPGFKEIEILAGHRDGVLQAEFSPDGRRVVSASADNTARLWPLFEDADTLLDTVRRALPRHLSLARREALRLPVPERMLQARERMAQGEQAARTGDPAAAEQHFRAALELDQSLHFDPKIKAEVLMIQALLGQYRLAEDTAQAEDLKQRLRGSSPAFFPQN